MRLLLVCGTHADVVGAVVACRPLHRPLSSSRKRQAHDLASHAVALTTFTYTHTQNKTETRG